MIKDIMTALLSPTRRLDRKPKDWAENLRPALDRPLSDREVPRDLRETVAKAKDALLRMQNPEDGYWYSALRADTTLESDTVMLLNFLGRGNSVKVRKLANRILSQQLPDGGWPIFKNGPADISATVKAYWALKFAGHAPNEPRLAAARRKIRELGGIHKVNTYTKFYMALFGQYDWRGVPTIPPEIMLFPNWFGFNIYEMSAWTRSIVVPLSIVWAYQPAITCPPQATLDELFPNTSRHIPLKEAVGPHSFFSWTTFFLMWDEGLKAIEGKGGHWIRVWALRLAEDWILERLQGSDGLGAIYPGVVNTIMAMKCLGYPDTDPRLVEQLQMLDKMECPPPLPGQDAQTADELEYQPSWAPVWDTAIAVISLAEAGMPRDDESLVKATDWLIRQEVKIEGDWKFTNPQGQPGGWCFQFANSFYPDVDDSAMVMLALRNVYLDEPLASAREKACLRGLNWVLSMQSSTGGWAAFDKENTKAILTKIPFADHNAMIDPPYADITGRVLELLGKIGYDRRYGCVDKAVRFLRREQEEDGSWFGRWSVNYVYGTWQVLKGLAAVDEDMSQPHIRRAVAWLKSVQREDGGWGETCAAYSDPALKGRCGAATPTQTAWAVMGLLAAGACDDSVRRGVDWLVKNQRADGCWDEHEWTGTGFPKVFYLEYPLYRQYFPLQALGLYQRKLREAARR